MGLRCGEYWYRSLYKISGKGGQNFGIESPELVEKEVHLNLHEIPVLFLYSSHRPQLQVIDAEDSTVCTHISVDLVVLRLIS